MCQRAFISRIFDHNYIVPVSAVYDERNQLGIVSGNEYVQNESVDGWLERSSPNLITRIRVVSCDDRLKMLFTRFLQMLEIARTIRYIHSMGAALYSEHIQSVGGLSH